jgi:hypothetical protein
MTAASVIAALVVAQAPQVNYGPNYWPGRIVVVTSPEIDTPVEPLLKFLQGKRPGRYDQPSGAVWIIDENLNAFVIDEKMVHLQRLRLQAEGLAKLTDVDLKSVSKFGSLPEPLQRVAADYVALVGPFHQPPSAKTNFEWEIARGFTVTDGERSHRFQISRPRSGVEPEAWRAMSRALDSEPVRLRVSREQYAEEMGSLQKRARKSGGKNGVAVRFVYGMGRPGTEIKTSRTALDLLEREEEVLREAIRRETERLREMFTRLTPDLFEREKLDGDLNRFPKGLHRELRNALTHPMLGLSSDEEIDAFLRRAQFTDLGVELSLVMSFEPDAGLNIIRIFP